MTLFAWRDCVLAGEHEPGFGMVKSVRRLPAVNIVAALAGLLQLPAVFIHMTAGTVLAQSHVCLRQAPSIGQEQFFRGDILRLMTLLTFEAGVLAFQFVAGKAVLEFLASVFPVDQFVVAALMLDVTARTIRVAIAPMQASLSGQAALDRRMAIQAVVTKNLLMRTVAFAAVAESFKKRV